MHRKLRRLGGAGILVLLTGGIPACATAESPDREAPAAPPGPREMLQQIQTQRGDETRFGYVLVEDREPILAELAETPTQLTKGFMFREVGSEDAMLFLFPMTSFHSIWMKNCRSPLDVAWIREDGQVVHLEENLPPCEGSGPCPGYRPLQQGRYVLELAGGQAQRRGIRVGARVDLVLPN